jgi:putative SOS response-associated peptidase YedK
MFRRAYASRRCLVPIKGFFEWKDIHSTGKNKQPYAIAMESGEAFALAGLWESWRDPQTGLDQRTFTIVTCEPNEMMATIHDRMPVILHPEDYDRWLGSDPDPSDLMAPFPAEMMTMWPIGKGVGSPKNNTPDILDPVDADEGPEPTLL